ncbi:MAG: DedA family protein [Candidatus Paceibacterota bacterium]|jgi:membrane protein DedA with SNARE-associated domain
MNLDLPQIFTYALGFSATFKYLLLFVGVIVEGPILMVICGFFLRLDALESIPLFITLFSGDLLADAIWYYIGAHHGERVIIKHGKFFGVTPERFEKVRELFFRYHDRILLISKVTVGFGMAIPVLIVAGASKVSFRRFMFLNAMGEFILVAVLLTVGYLFGELYNSIAEGFKEVFAVAAILVAGAAIYGFSNFMKQKIAGTK